MKVLYINGSVYSVIFDGRSSNHGTGKAVVVEAGEFKITYTFRVNYGYLFVNYTRLLPSPCDTKSESIREVYDAIKGTWYGLVILSHFCLWITIDKMTHAPHPNAPPKNTRSNTLTHIHTQTHKHTLTCTSTTCAVLCDDAKYVSISH